MPEYFLAYRAASFSGELLGLLEQFTEFAGQHQVLPVVVFVPRDKYDTRSVAKFLQMNKDQLPEELLIVDVGETNVDWEQYNLLDKSKENNINICHPSPYGHQKIAASINQALQERQNP